MDPTARPELSRAGAGTASAPPWVGPPPAAQVTWSQDPRRRRSAPTGDFAVPSARVVNTDAPSPPGPNQGRALAGSSPARLSTVAGAMPASCE